VEAGPGGVLRSGGGWCGAGCAQGAADGGGAGAGTQAGAGTGGAVGSKTGAYRRHDQRVAGQVEVDVLEVVLAGAADDEAVHVIPVGRAR